MKKRMSTLEQEFSQIWLTQYPDVDLHYDYPFLRGRRYRGDFVHKESKTIIECQGGIWIRGSHSTGSGILRDCEKSLLAAEKGWQIIPLATGMINEGNLAKVHTIIKLRGDMTNASNSNQYTSRKRRATTTKKSVSNRRRV